MSFKDYHVLISLNTGNGILWNRFCNGCNVLDINFVGCIIFGESYMVYHSVFIFQC